MHRKCPSSSQHNIDFMQEEEVLVGGMFWFCNHLAVEERASCFTLCCDCVCSVLIFSQCLGLAFDYGISWSYSLTF